MKSKQPVKKKQDKAPDVLKYDNHIKFLKDFYDYHKENTKNFSYLSFAQKAEISKEHLRMVLSGTRKLSIPQAKKYAKALGFKKIEERHFLLLIQMEHPIKVKYTFSSEPEGILAKGITRKACQLKDFRPDPEWISKKVGGIISPAQAGRALKQLIADGELKVEKDTWTLKKQMRFRILADKRNKAQHRKLQEKICNRYSRFFKGAANRSICNTLITVPHEVTREIYNEVLRVISTYEADSIASPKKTDQIWGLCFTMADITRPFDKEKFL